MAFQDPSATPPHRPDRAPVQDRSGHRRVDRLAFLQGFIRAPARVGSLIPSSERLERRLLREARITGAQTVVELGPGTGGTTAALLGAMPPDGRLLALELDPVFHRHLAHQLLDARLRLELASALRLEDCLAHHGLPPPEAIVSGIPFSTIPAHQAHGIAAAIARALAPGGRFVAYQVRPHVARYLQPHLGAPRVTWEWANLPPVRVFTWIRHP